jgi:protein SCO1/2
MSIRNKKTFIFAIICVIIFPIGFGYFFLEVLDRPSLDTKSCLPYYGPKKPYTHTVKDKEVVDTFYHQVSKFKLVNHLGDTITHQALEGKVTIVDFFFTTCRTICIPMTNNMGKLQEHFNKDKGFLQLMSFTVDPDVDSVGKLYVYAQDKSVNSQQWQLITGDKVELYKLARMGFLISAETAGDGGPTDFIHDNRMVLIDREKNIRGYYDGTSDKAIEKLIADAEKLLVSYAVPMKDDIE